MAKPVHLFWFFRLLTFDKIHFTKDYFCLLCKNTHLALHLSLDFKSVGVFYRLIYHLIYACGSILTNKCAVVLS